MLIELMWYGFNGHVHKRGIKSHGEVFNEEETKAIHAGIQGRIHQKAGQAIS